ncbi:MAG: amidohydrolase [Oscillospiraceae bacterium]|nr:amidohydrolase [Oscillospiraceae bacterium]
MKITDVHAHIFPQKIALKASGATGDFYGIKMHHDGMPHTLKNELSRAGISRALVCSPATTAHQVESINDFIAEKCEKYPEFVGLATLHPETPDPEREILRSESLGLRGVKFHPDFQRFAIDDEKMFPTYKILEERKLPILFHMGDKRYPFSNPHRLVTVMEKFPDLIVVGAHFGGYSEWESVMLYPRSRNLFFDTSSSLWKLSYEEAARLISHFGAEQFMFGSDFPMWTPSEELEKFFKIGLSDEENEMILNGNFERLFGL